MQILPLAYDSFGVRSMATLVRLKNFTIVIDPGVALGPTRYGLSPTDAEFEALEYSRQMIMEACRDAELVVVTHYHYDHHPFPDDLEMYERCFRDKIAFAKDRKHNINLSGKKRGAIFEERASPLAKRIEWADGKTVEHKKARIHFSPAVWHGDVGSKVGRVIMVYIEEDKNSFLFGSDAQGLADPQALDWVLERDPKFMILDGYPTLFLGWRMSQKAFEASKENLKRALRETQAETVILEHHLLRDIAYKEKMRDVLQLAERTGKRLLSWAEYLGLENFFLEAWRKEIHEGKREVDVRGYYTALCKRIGIPPSVLQVEVRRRGIEE